MADRRLLALLLLAACKDTPEQELGLRHRSGDAGPAVVVVDKGAGTELPVTDEREPNEARTGGQPLAVPGAMRGRLDTPPDWDVFLVKVPAAGTLGVKLAAVDNVDLVLEVHDESGDVLVVSDGGGTASVEAIPNLFVQPSQYRLVVHQAPASP